MRIEDIEHTEIEACVSGTQVKTSVVCAFVAIRLCVMHVAWMHVAFPMSRRTYATATNIQRIGSFARASLV